MLIEDSREVMAHLEPDGAPTDPPVGRFRRFFGAFRLLPGIYSMRLGVEWAAALAFHTLLALVPLIIIAFSLLGFIQDYFELDTKLEQGLLNRGLPEAAEQAGEVIQGLVDNVRSSSTGIGALGIVFLLVTALGLYGTFESACNALWRVRRASYLRRVRHFLVALLVGPVLIGLSLYATFRLRGLAFAPNRWEWAGPSLKAAAWVAPFLLTWILFYCTITFLPNTKVRHASAILGAIAAGTLWELAKKGFNLYVEYSTQIDTLYGPIGILPLFIIWVHVTWMIVLLGVQLAHCHQHYPRVAAEVVRKKAERKARRERLKRERAEKTKAEQPTTVAP